MEGDFRAVAAMNKNEIERNANRLRRALGLDDAARVSLIRLLPMFEEWIEGFVFHVLEDEEMPGMDGYTGLDDYEICLSNTTYERLEAGDPYARHTAAHEIGHLMLHCKAATAYARRSTYHSHVDPEWQADTYADVLLMPTEGIKECCNPEEVAERFSVPLERAEIRFAQVQNVQGELFV